MVVDNKAGQYRFLRGISPYSAGVVSMPGHEIVHARFLSPVPLKEGFAAVERHLEQVKRPKQALCAMELRSPKPFTFRGFSEFNATYVAVLKEWNILTEGLNPVARTNVAPAVAPPREPSLYGFSYTAPTQGNHAPTFVIAGAGELPEGSLNSTDVVRSGETSPDAIAEKARFVLGLMDQRLRGLGAGWDRVTAAGLYTVHDIAPLLAGEILPRMGGARHGLNWYYSRPPIESIEYEMDLRGCRREVVIGL